MLQLCFWFYNKKKTENIGPVYIYNMFTVTHISLNISKRCKHILNIHLLHLVKSNPYKRTGVIYPHCMPGAIILIK